MKSYSMKLWGFGFCLCISVTRVLQNFREFYVCFISFFLFIAEQYFMIELNQIVLTIYMLKCWYRDTEKVGLSYISDGHVNY